MCNKPITVPSPAPFKKQVLLHLDGEMASLQRIEVNDKCEGRSCNDLYESCELTLWSAADKLSEHLVFSPYTQRQPGDFDPAAQVL